MNHHHCTELHTASDSHSNHKSIKLHANCVFARPESIIRLKSRWLETVSSVDNTVAWNYPVKIQWFWAWTIHLLILNIAIPFYILIYISPITIFQMELVHFALSCFDLHHSSCAVTRVLVSFLICAIIIQSFIKRMIFHWAPKTLSGHEK